MQTLFDTSRVQKSTNGEEKEEYKIVSVRLRWAEFEGLNEQARELGLTNNMALRIAIRRIGGFLETDAQTRHQLNAIVRMIGEISQDIRRLSDVCEHKKDVDMETFKSHRIAFGTEFQKLDGLLRNLLNTGRRRSDGRHMLAKAVAQ